MRQTRKHLFLLHDGARYHTSQATQQFFTRQHQQYHTSQATQQFFTRQHQRITAHPLPAYSPDDNPREYLGKKTQQRGTHHKYFQEVATLIGSVEEAFAYFSTPADEGLCLFGCSQEESGWDLQQAA
jgi:hypothetical protein